MERQQWQTWKGQSQGSFSSPSSIRAMFVIPPAQPRADSQTEERTNTRIVNGQFNIHPSWQWSQTHTRNKGRRTRPLFLYLFDCLLNLLNWIPQMFFSGRFLDQFFTCTSKPTIKSVLSCPGRYNKIHTRNVALMDSGRRPAAPLITSSIIISSESLSAATRRQGKDNADGWVINVTIRIDF